jgi:hypothetical protein
MKMEKAIESAPVTLEYLPVRYCWICHTPSRNKTAGIRCEKMLTVLLWMYNKLQNEL